MINRRNFVIGTGAAVAFADLPARAAGAGGPDVAVESLLAEMAEELLAEYPENATNLGIDRGKRAALKSKLADRSPDGQRSIAERAQKRLKRLKESAERVKHIALFSTFERLKSGRNDPWEDCNGQTTNV